VGGLGKLDLFTTEDTEDTGKSKPLYHGGHWGTEEVKIPPSRTKTREGWGILFFF